MVAHSVNYSGANRSFFSVIKGLSSEHHIEVIVNDKVGELIDKCNSIGIKTHYCKYDWMYAHYRKNIVKQVGRFLIDYYHYASSNIPENLIGELRKTKFDLVYSNTGTIDIGIRIAKKLNIPHCWHIREFGKEDFGFIQLVSNRRLNSYFNYTDKVIVISKALEDKYKRIVNEKKLFVVYNGLETSEISYYGDHNNDSDSYHILVTGVVSKGKGQAQAIRAINDLVKRGYNIELFLAGAVDKSFLEEVLSGIDSYEEWLHVLGPVKDMYELRKKMNCELVCSVSEAFGRVTIEAMLHGLPVIGANSGCTRELITHKINGLLYQSGNIDDLELKIENLINDPSLGNRLKQNGRRFAQDFTIERTVSGIEEILHSFGV